jgi:hypothetical protein
MRFVLAAVPFIVSLALLGIAVQSGAFLKFALSWPVVQAMGYGATIRLAKGDVTHPLVSAQIALHWLVLALLIGLIVRGV